MTNASAVTVILIWDLVLFTQLRVVIWPDIKRTMAKGTLRPCDTFLCTKRQNAGVTSTSTIERNHLFISFMEVYNYHLNYKSGVVC